MSKNPRGNAGIAVGITFTSISLFTLLARLYTRYFIVRDAGHEDWTVVLAWFFSAAHTSLVVVEIHNSLGRHLVDYSLEQQKHILIPFYASFSMYSISLALSKISILLMYMRLFPGKRFNIACWTTIAVLLICLVRVCFGLMFMCTPVAFLWDKTLKGTCLDGRIIYFTSASLNVITDFAIFFLPMPILAKLQLPRRQKVALILLFGVGLVGCAISILRLQALYLLSISNDYVYDVLLTAIWSEVEANVGFFCACVPSLKPLLTAIIPHIWHENSSASRRRDRFIGSSHIKSPHNPVPGIFLSHRAYAQFDVEDQGPKLEPGQVRVTTEIVQESDDNSNESVKGMPFE